MRWLQVEVQERGEKESYLIGIRKARAHTGEERGLWRRRVYREIMLIRILLRGFKV